VCISVPVCLWPSAQLADSRQTRVGYRAGDAGCAACGRGAAGRHAAQADGGRRARRVRAQGGQVLGSFQAVPSTPWCVATPRPLAAGAIRLRCITSCIASITSYMRCGHGTKTALGAGKAGCRQQAHALLERQPDHQCLQCQTETIFSLRLSSNMRH
jgi:hypothetical protein